MYKNVLFSIEEWKQNNKKNVLYIKEWMNIVDNEWHFVVKDMKMIKIIVGHGVLAKGS